MEQAQISPFDRGFLFGDGIYEGLRSAALPPGRRIIGLHRHINRMAHGLRATGIDFDATTLGTLTDQLLDANKLRDAFIYWQITRGTPDLAIGPVRSRVPPKTIRPTIFGYCTPLPTLDSQTEPAVKPACIGLDTRWTRGDIKSVSLLGNILAALEAARHGGEEAILVRPAAQTALVTEGTYTNIIIALPRAANGTDLPPPFDRFDVITPALESAPMLAGVTRDILLDSEHRIREQAVQMLDLANAAEIMLLGTTTMVTSITTLDGRQIGSGKPGPVARYLLNVLLGAIRSGHDDLPRQRATSDRAEVASTSAL